MPSKKVSPVDIVLSIKGSEKLQKLNSSFRDLSKQLNKLSAGDLQKATDDVRKFAAESGNSEATIRAQIKAFEGLRSQAAMGGKVYRELGASIIDLGLTLKGSSAQIEEQRSALLEIGSAASSSSAQIKKAIDGLKQLRNQASQDSQAFFGLSKEIDELTKKVNSLDAALEQNASRNRARAASVTGVLAKYEAIARKQAQAAKEREEIVRGEVIALSEKGRATEELAKKENQLTAAIARRKQLGVQETAREARRSVRAGAQVYTGKTELGPIDALDRRLGDLPATTAAFSQRLTELQDRLINTVRSSDQYVAVALRIAQVQREATATAQGLGAALVKDLASGNTVRNQKNLREAIGQLQAEMNELNTETAEGSSKYAENARQVNNLQKELNEIAGSYRNVTDMARQASTAQGVYANTSVASNYLRRGIVRQQEAARAELGAAVRAGVASTQLALPAAGQTTAPGTGLARSGMARGVFDLTGNVTRGRPVPADFPGLKEDAAALPTAATGVNAALGMSEPIKKQANALREAATAYKPYNAEIRKAKAANNGSISGINNLKAALERKRNELPTTTAAFKRLTQQIENLDRQSEKASKGMSRRRFSPGKAAQVAGATLSGGIFGGPEGFLGGALGGALGGVGGSFAGAALGAQVGQLRQQLGGFAEYAASIEKLKIALNGIAGDASNYNRALQAAADVTKELNIPQEVAIKGITRLTAAVKGAGGGIADAELAFKNINSAIIATGGGAEQVEGAVTALVQIFSKGKVSAEEINQIAERLPGTFNKIAEASGRTGPELTKALQQGEVGLNDLMKFLVQLGGEYGELAEKIAGSSESAGARLTVAYNKMRIEIGKALQPIGAEFQEAFLEFITDIGPSLVVMAKAVGEGMRFIIQNRGAILTIASFAAKLVAVNFALKAFVALNGPLKLMFALIRTGFRQTTQQASLAATKLARFGATVKTLAASLVAPIVITFAIVGAELVISYFNRIKQAKADLDASGTKPQGEVFFRSIGGTAATKETLRSNFKDIVKNLDIVEARLAKTKKSIKEFKASQSDGGERAMGGSAPPLAGVAVPEDLTSRLKADEAEIARLRLNYKTLIEKYPSAPEAAKGLTDYGSLTGTDTGGGGGGGGKFRESQLPRLQDKYDSLIRSGPLADIQRFQIANSLALVRAQKDNNTELVYTIKNNAINLDFGEKELGVRNKYLDAMNAANKTEDIAERQLQEKIAGLERDLDLEKLSVSANGELLALKQDQAIASEIIAKASEDELFNLRDQLGLVTKKQKIDRFRQSRIDAGDPNAEQQTDLFRQTIDPTLTEGLSQNIRGLKKELEDLVNPINQITGAANAIGSAFSQSFTNAITGATSAKQALADFFKSVGSYFLDMAGQIIAKMVTMAVLNTVVNLLPGGGFNLGSTPLGAGGGEVGGIGTLGPNFGIAQRAAGGPVNANTPYIVGERGPELMVPSGNGTIIPNDVFSASRAAISGGGPLGAAGNSGDLGKDGMVESRNYISNNYSTQQAIAQSQAAVSSSSMSMERVIERKAAERQATEMSEPIRVKLDTTVINNVEYLTVEQGLALSESASRKARSQVFSDLRQRPASRSKVGLG
jgi:tape measure domain-containing protein